MNTTDEQSVLLPNEYATTQKSLVAALEWFSDLHQQVSDHGVSQEEVRALGDMLGHVQKLPAPEITEDDFEFTRTVPWATPALEAYPIKSFTSERTTLNQEVALEGIAQAMVQTLQKLLRTLSAVVGTTMDYLKKAIRSETISGFKLKNLYNAVLKAAEGATQIETKYLHDTSRIEKELVKYRHKILDDSPVKRTPFQLAAFGDREFAPKVEMTIKQIHDSAPALERYLTQVKQVLGQRNATNTEALSNHPVFRKLKELRWDVENLSEKSSSKDYVSTRRGLTYLTDGPKPRARFPEKAGKLVQYKKQLSMFEQLDRQLNQIWKQNLVGDGEDLKPVLEGLRKASRAVENLQSVTEFLFRYNQAKRSALKVAYKLENKRFSMMYGAAKEAAITEPQKEGLRELKDEYTQVIATLLS